jgi:hypothetical protein
VGHRLVVRPGEGLEGDRALSTWLTGRWRAWTRFDGRFAAVGAQHEPWPLVDATLIEGHETLRADAGLVSSAEPPVVHFASAVNVQLGWPEAPDGRVRRAGAPTSRAGRTARWFEQPSAQAGRPVTTWRRHRSTASTKRERGART